MYLACSLMSVSGRPLNYVLSLQCDGKKWQVIETMHLACILMG
jgi:hypothetical protein